MVTGVPCLLFIPPLLPSYLHNTNLSIKARERFFLYSLASSLGVLYSVNALTCPGHHAAYFSALRHNCAVLFLLAVPEL